MNKLHKGPPINASCQVWFHLAKWFQRRRFLKTRPIRIKNCPWWPCLSSDWDKMNKLHTGPPIDASCQVWFHLAKRFQRRRFLKIQPIRIKNCPWRPCLSSNPDEMNKLYKGPYIDASCQVWFHLAQQFQSRRFLKTQPIRIKNCLWRPCFLSDRDEMNKLHKGPPIDASCKVWFRLAKRFQRRRFLKIQPIRIKNYPWRPCFLSDRDEMNKLYKGPPIDASCKVWFHLAKQFQRRRFLKIQPIRIKNCLWRPCLLSDRDEMNKLYKGPYIDASCQVWFHLALQFQRRRLKCEKLRTDGRTDDGRRTLHGGKSSHDPLGQVS